VSYHPVVCQGQDARARQQGRRYAAQEKPFHRCVAPELDVELKAVVNHREPDAGSKAGANHRELDVELKAGANHRWLVAG
jgi:hypothetical protein